MASTRIAFLGTGLMGAPMASNLLRDGHPVTVWNRTRAKAEALQSLGASVADSPAEAADGADVVILILENGGVVEQVLFDSGLVERLAPGALVIDMSSIAPAKAIEHAERLAKSRIGHLDAPVSGGPGGAEERSLAIMVGGEDADFARGLSILQTFGRPTHVGAAGAGQLVKLCSQMISGAAMCAVSEVLVLARTYGIDVARIPAALAGGFADSKVLQIHGKRMFDRDFEPGGHVRTFHKDLGAANEMISRRALDLPVAKLVYEMFGSLSSEGRGELDISSMLLELERRNPGAKTVDTAQRFAPMPELQK
jgi:2-hydroxy-3-oxopropionate reductase